MSKNHRQLIINGTFAFHKIQISSPWRTWKQCKFRIYFFGVRYMNIGVTLALPNNHYQMGVRMPFGKWLYRNKFKKAQEECTLLNERDPDPDYPYWLDRYGYLRD